jgi:hypothetical protein
VRSNVEWLVCQSVFIDMIVDACEANRSLRRANRRPRYAIPFTQDIAHSRVKRSLVHVHPALANATDTVGFVFLRL